MDNSETIALDKQTLPNKKDKGGSPALVRQNRHQSLAHFISQNYTGSSVTFSEYKFHLTPLNVR